MFTEEEAKTKWCPMVRFHNGYGGGIWDNKPGSREQATDTSTNCIASDCMMWRTYKDKVIETDSHGNAITIVSKEEEGGYCGLAGK